MSNETKRDVFDELLKMFRNSMALTHEEPVVLDNDGYDVFGKIEKSYDAALPDDLPVIPNYVAKYINYLKSSGHDIWDAINYPFTDRINKYMKDNSDIFALAWVLGVWRVEETGEVVKL